MRWLLLMTLATTPLLGCTAQTMCDSLEPGRPVSGLPTQPVLTRDPFGLPGLMGRTSSAFSGSWDKGPVEPHLCCFLQRLGEPASWCSAEQLQCDDFQGVEVVYLREPYSDQSLAPESADFCFAAVKNGLIDAVWFRHWS
jgi:hypothetical protein